MFEEEYKQTSLPSPTLNLSGGAAAKPQGRASGLASGGAEPRPKPRRSVYSHSAMEGPEAWGLSREAALEVTLFGVVMSGGVLDLAGRADIREFGVLVGWPT